MKQFIQYTYDLAGNRTRVIEPGGGRFTCSYDSLNRLATLENPQSQRTTLSYDDNSRRTASRLSNGSRASFTYDAASNITRLANLKSDLTTLSSFDSRYDKVSNRQAMIEGDGARTSYSYDNSWQLLAEHRTGSSAYRNTYIYDSAANRTLKNESGTRTTTTYDAANQINYALAAAGRTTYTYDADGNQQRVLEPSGVRTTTLWDFENKTRLIQLPSGVRNTMSYEPDGLRVQVQSSLGTSRFIYDGQAFLLETDGSNVTVAVFTNEPSVYTNAISQRRGSTTSWFQFDALGSTRQLTDASQNITDTYLSNAWGVPLSATGSTTNWLRYVGRYGYWFEPDTENYNIGQRAYRPVIARWTSVDPAGFVDGVALYILHSIVIAIDPTESVCRVVKKAVHTTEKIAALDATLTGGAHQSLADRVTASLTKRFKNYHIKYSKLEQAGLFAADSEAFGRFPNNFPAGDYRAAHLLLFVAFDVCETALADCRLMFDEDLTVTFTDGSKDPLLKPRTDITFNADDVASSNRKVGGDKVLIYVDAPGAIGFIEDRGLVRDRLKRRGFSIKGKMTLGVVDATNPAALLDSVDVNVNHKLAINGKLT